MKIIADCNDGSFLVQMCRSEIEDLAGIGWRDTKVKVGATLKAGENAGRIRDFRSKRTQCLSAADDLRSLATLLESSLHDLMPEPVESVDAEMAS